jgi:murein DD-endopeptidase MepM/ murein hydrolase activator NlpD
MSGCVKLPEQQTSAWPWEYGRGQGEPNVPDYISFRAGVANFDEPPRTVKPVTPESIGLPAPEATSSTALPAPAVIAETAVKKSTETDKDVAIPNKDYDFKVGEKISSSALLQAFNTDNSDKEFIAYNNGGAPVSVAIDIDRSASQNASVNVTLPYYTVVPANTNKTLLQLSPQKSGTHLSFRYSYQWTIGDYTARHNCPEQYRFPFNKKVRAYAHVSDTINAHPSSRYAVVFTLPKGTPVLAARKGTVVRIHPNGKIDILHDDATIATYSNLEAIARDIAVGKTITTEDAIGVAGTAENNKDAYIQLTVWRPEPQTSSALLVSVQEIGFNSVSFPLPFSVAASDKGKVLVENQLISSGQLPAINKQPKRKPKSVNHTEK